MQGAQNIFDNITNKNAIIYCEYDVIFYQLERYQGAKYLFESAVQIVNDNDKIQHAGLKEKELSMKRN